MGGDEDVGVARYEPAILPPSPTIRVLSYSNCQRSTYSNSRAWQLKCFKEMGEGCTKLLLLAMPDPLSYSVMNKICLNQMKYKICLNQRTKDVFRWSMPINSFYKYCSSLFSILVQISRKHFDSDSILFAVDVLHAPSMDWYRKRYPHHFWHPVLVFFVKIVLYFGIFSSRWNCMMWGSNIFVHFRWKCWLLSVVWLMSHNSLPRTMSYNVLYMTVVVVV